MLKRMMEKSRSLHMTQRIKKKSKRRDTNKFHSNFKKDCLQAIMKPINSLKVIFYGEI